MAADIGEDFCKSMKKIEEYPKTPGSAALLAKAEALFPSAKATAKIVLFIIRRSNLLGCFFMSKAQYKVRA